MIQRSNETGIPRRQLLKYAVGGIGALLTAAVAGPVIRYFIAPGLAQEQAKWVPIALASEIPVGAPTLVRYEERAQDSWVVNAETKTAWVLTRDGRNFITYDPHCTHLGCAYYWNQEGKHAGHFFCPCHDGVYDIDGNVVSGPPPRPLNQYQVKVEDDQLFILGG